jgi:hypothetical protein
MDITYKLLKLSSGEELITKILKKKDGTVYMESPMTFRSTIMSDPYTGGQKEITILKDWIGYSSENTIKIPESFILSYSNPIEAAIELYEKEKEKKLNDTKKQEIKNYDDINKEMLKDFQSMIDQVRNNDDDTEPPTLPFGMNPESFKRIMDHMSNEYEFELEFIVPSEEISDETTEKEINHPDYGNRWTDWCNDTRKY